MGEGFASGDMSVRGNREGKKDMKGRPYPKDVQAEVMAADRENREIAATSQLFETLGHEKRPVLKVLRSFCLDCMGEQPSMVRKCTSGGCDLWPYRMGRNPFREPGKAPAHGFQKKEGSDGTG